MNRTAAIRRRRLGRAIAIVVNLALWSFLTIQCGIELIEQNRAGSEIAAECGHCWGSP